MIIHPASEVHMRAMLADLPQSLMIASSPGVGAFTAAKILADSHPSALLTPKDTKGEESPLGAISVEAIRSLYTQTRAKQTTRQVIIIDNADRMSAGAQAAFLKLLEEPGQHVHFILTTHEPQHILATIHSRVQHIHLQPITRNQSEAFIESLGVHDSKKRAQLLFIAEGYPAELRKLIESDEYFEAKARIVADARDLLQLTPYDRLQIVQRYHSDRASILQLVDMALKLLQRGLASNPQHPYVAQIQRLLEIRDAITRQQNPRLQLTQFVL